jgi:hypothetical protein
MRSATCIAAAFACHLLLSNAASAQGGQGLTGMTQTRTAAAQYLGVSLDGLFSSGWATAKEEEIAELQGGAHDPKKRGFTVQNIEMSLLGAVDPYLLGEAHLIYQLTPEGESILEVEETFLTTTALPAGLQLKAGHFFVEFGRLNPRHPHAWNFADQPVVNTRMFGGDGLRAPGVRLSWLAPLPWYADLAAGAHNANGETAFSFLSAAEEGEEAGFAGHPFVERPVKGPGDLLYSFRWLNSVDLGTKTANLGASALFGPNPTGKDTRTRILGGDLYLKWKPRRTHRGWPFAALQAEVMNRRYEVEGPSGPLDDWGLYLEGLWGFRTRWVAGLRADWADGDGASGGEEDPRRDRRFRLSPVLTWYPSEFSKLRFQYNHDRAEHLDDQAESAFWTQFEFMLGTHPAHSF